MITRCTIPAEVAGASVEDGTVLLHMGTKRYFSLNETGAEIWRMIEQDVPVADIPGRLSATFDVPIEDARVATSELLAELAQHGLLTLETE